MCPVWKNGEKKSLHSRLEMYKFLVKLARFYSFSDPAGKSDLPTDVSFSHIHLIARSTPEAPSRTGHPQHSW
jgi:hypothetical protein